MLRLAADENFNADVVRGLRRRFPDLDLVRIQDIGLSGADDPTVLAWADREQRVLLTHDVTTLVGLALMLVTDGTPMAGVIAVASRAPVGAARDIAQQATHSGLTPTCRKRGDLVLLERLGDSRSHQSPEGPGSIPVIDQAP